MNNKEKILGLGSIRNFMTFLMDGEEIGRLDRNEVTGVLEFHGNAEESARIFYENVILKYEAYCQWEYIHGSDYGFYQTECERVVIPDTEHLDMKHCSYCGKKIRIKEYD